jgi:hypothetical protein
MKTTRKSDSQIMQILSQAGSGIPVSELCREYGISGVLNTVVWIINDY